MKRKQSLRLPRGQESSAEWYCTDGRKGWYVGQFSFGTILIGRVDVP